MKVVQVSNGWKSNDTTRDLYSLRRGNDRLHVNQLLCQQLGDLFYGDTPGAGLPNNHAGAGQSFPFWGGGGGSGGLYSPICNQEVSRALIYHKTIKLKGV